MLEIMLYWVVYLVKELNHCPAFSSIIIYLYIYIYIFFFFQILVQFFFFFFSFSFLLEKPQYIIKLLKLWTKI